MNNCDICGGSGFIRLPVREKYKFTIEGTSNIRSLESREYACPECNENNFSEKVQIVQVAESISTYDCKDEIVEYVKESMAHSIGSFLYKEGYIDYTIGKEDIYNKSKRIKAKCAVLSKKQLKSFEEKVNERQKYIADAVVNEIIKKLSNWHLEDIITKSIVIRFCYEALEKVK